MFWPMLQPSKSLMYRNLRPANSPFGSDQWRMDEEAAIAFAPMRTMPPGGRLAGSSAGERSQSEVAGRFLVVREGHQDAVSHGRYLAELVSGTTRLVRDMILARAEANARLLYFTAGLGRVNQGNRLKVQAKELPLANAA
jgi:hypothetical protein